MSDSIFEELLNLDRPYLPATVKVGGKDLKVQVRRLNAADQDALDVYGTDEYGRLVVEYTEPQNGKKSELDRVIQVYRTLTRKELVDQILGTRASEITTRAMHLSGLDPIQVGERLKQLEGSEKEEYEKDINAALNSARHEAAEELASEYSTRSDDELADIMAQVNINVKANSEAGARQSARRLYYQIYKEDDTRLFPSIDSVMELSRETVMEFRKSVDEAFNKWVIKTLPFESQAVPEPSGQPSLQSTSEAATKTGGKPTRTSRKG